MAKVVFILGAGASAHAGVPVMKNFYYEGVGLKPNLSNYDVDHFERIIDARNLLRQIYAGFTLEPRLSNIETIYGLIEMGNLIKIFLNYNQRKIKELRNSINKFIVRTVELKTNFYFNQAQGFLSTDLYSYLVNKIIEIQKAENRLFPFKSCVITFNYDIAFDFALEKASIGDNGINYCLSRKDNKERYKLIKLHGSINWGICSKNHINPISIENFLNKHLQKIYKKHGFPPDGPVNIEISPAITELKCSECGKTLLDNPIIIPPTWNKSVYHRYISYVWHQAAREISEAEYLIIIGYSLPETDLFFKYLLILGAIDSINLKKICVIDSNKEVITKFKKFMGPENEDKFCPYPKPFKDAIDETDFIDILDLSYT